MKTRRKLTAGQKQRIICWRCLEIIEEKEVPAGSVFYGVGLSLCTRCGAIPMTEFVKKMFKTR